MAIIYNSKESFEKVKKYLIENQYLFECIETDNSWEIIIKEYYKDC